MKNLWIVGAGGWGCAVADAVADWAEAGAPYRVAGFVDDRWPALAEAWSLPVVGTLAHLPALRERADAVLLAIGDNTSRRLAFDRALAARYELPSLLHPRAVVSRRAQVGRGAVLMAGAVVGAEAQVGDGAIVNAGVVVEHHCRVGAFARLSVGACMAGGAVLGDGAWLQEGAALSPGQQVAAGAVLSRATATGG